MHEDCHARELHQGSFTKHFYGEGPEVFMSHQGACPWSIVDVAYARLLVQPHSLCISQHLEFWLLVKHLEFNPDHIARCEFWKRSQKRADLTPTRLIVAFIQIGLFGLVYFSRLTQDTCIHLAIPSSTPCFSL
jgi:hypothetical protein